MFKCIDLTDFVYYLFDDQRMARKAAVILKALLEAQSPRLSMIAEKVDKKAEAAYKMVQRFLAECDPRPILLRLFQEGAAFVLGDVTEMPRPGARKTAYVGTLKDGATLGYWLLVLSTPCRGRALPFHFVTYSSETIGQEITSRNQEHFRAFARIKDLLGDKPLVLDREFSYLELLQILVLEAIHFVIRLKVGAQPVKFVDKDGQPLKLVIQPGQKISYRDVWYLGKVRVNLSGAWKPDLSEPCWILTDLEPEQGLAIYQQRMKIEESFRDCKSLLHLPQAMNKQRENLEKTIALTLLAYAIGLLLGEAVRDVTYRAVDPRDLRIEMLNRYPKPEPPRKWKLYSGLFVLLKQKPRLSENVTRQITHITAEAFARLIFGNVPSFV
jgi:hypothetical protein